VVGRELFVAQKALIGAIVENLGNVFTRVAPRAEHPYELGDDHTSLLGLIDARRHCFVSFEDEWRAMLLHEIVHVIGHRLVDSIGWIVRHGPRVKDRSVFGDRIIEELRVDPEHTERKHRNADRSRDGREPCTDRWNSPSLDGITP
jgi:hypothetical protein